ncbi:MAG TPA: S46 family peptidase [Myxococcaceae bacterium]|nr:S46 family peptidase [Myxococcaceae bacterium]
MTRTPLLALLLLAGVAAADEGMWTFNNFPSQKVKEKYGFEPTKQWLDHVRLSSARLGGGCSASFVSENGLVMTNHHCARGCIEDLSDARHDYLQSGFYARTLHEELRCPAIEVNQLLEISDVTDRVHSATRGLEGEKFHAAQKAEMARIERECARGDEVRCDVVMLYKGGLFNLYRYRRFQDVRLVFAPEHAIAFFGGDPDNFEFPRYDLDVSFLRIYENGKPAKSDHFFRWSAAGAHKGELVFVSGNPGETSRLDTIAELAYQRDYALPEKLNYLAELRGMITEFQNRGPEQRRISNNVRFSVENSFKALTGRRLALVDEKLFGRKRAEEKSLRDKVEADPQRRQAYGDAWARIDEAVQQVKNIRRELTMLEHGAGGRSELFSIARTLLRAGDELPRPNEERLREYSYAKLPFLKQRLFSPAPIYPELETALVTFWLVKLREQLGPDDPAVKAILGKESPASIARRAVSGSKLADVKLRKELWDGSARAVAASRDPMIALARAVDGPARAMRKRYEDQIESAINKNKELIAKARFEIYGTSHYPDATFSARLSYGAVEGYVEEGRRVEPITYMGGIWDRATGEDPFGLPATWLKARRKLDPRTPMNFASSNDIIGGNSGSPVINKEAEIVGLIFDGNIQSLGGEYGFEESVNRAVSVHSQALIEALDKVYGATRLLGELRPASKGIGQTGAQ